eukprot:TRINITY_DN6714_c0_g1_i1.p1 TRINITY_DN6714_c0_g1~~TRINITY_DN6714_c0_g1_i1.p1  ORF type:complete len:238 (+),score=63.64 TRINITY_DN6714_c0_g1_i1:36-716(+)
MDVDEVFEDPMITLHGDKGAKSVKRLPFPLDQFVRDAGERYVEEKKEIDYEVVGVFPSVSGLEASRKSRPKRHAARLGRKQRRKLMNTDPSSIKFKDMLQLHALWEEYIHKVIWGVGSLETQKKNASNELICSSLLRADMHGCLVSIEQCKTPEWVGIAGIVFLETLNTLQIVTKEDRVLKVLKANCVFGFQVGGYHVTLLGCQVKCRPGERSGKLFKNISKFEIP